MKYLFLTIIFLSGFYIAGAQKLSITTAVDKQSILIGEQFTLTVKAENLPAGATWLELDTLPHFEIFERSKIDSTLNDGRLGLSQTFTITSWDSGAWQLLAAPPAGVTGNNKPIVINVTHTPMDYAQDYHDVKDIMEVQKPPRTTWYWYLVGLLLLILLFLLFFPRGKRKPRPDFVPDQTIYQLSLKRLEALRVKKEEDPKVFHSELVAIFREYLAKRKGIQSHSKATDDLAVQLTNLRLPTTVYQPMLQSLRLSDLAKFARASPAPSENERSVDVIKKSITVIEELA